MNQQRRWPSLGAFVRHMVREQEWMSVKAAAELYRVTDETMLAWARNGHFPTRVIDGELRLDRSALHEALRRMPANQLGEP
jgi:excisionase family DNA binding protein